MTAHLVFFVGDDGVVRGAGIFSEPRPTLMNPSMVMLPSDIAVGHGETYGDAVADLRSQILAHAHMFGCKGSPVRQMADALATDEHVVRLPEAAT